MSYHCEEHAFTCKNPEPGTIRIYIDSLRCYIANRGIQSLTHNSEILKPLYTTHLTKSLQQTALMSKFTEKLCEPFIVFKINM